MGIRDDKSLRFHTHAIGHLQNISNIISKINTPGNEQANTSLRHAFTAAHGHYMDSVGHHENGRYEDAARSLSLVSPHVDTLVGLMHDHPRVDERHKETLKSASAALKPLATNYKNSNFGSD